MLRRSPSALVWGLCGIPFTFAQPNLRHRRRRSTYVTPSTENDDDSDSQTIILILSVVSGLIVVLCALWWLCRTKDRRLADAGDAHAIHDVPSYHSDTPPVYTAEAPVLFLKFQRTTVTCGNERILNPNRTVTRRRELTRSRTMFEPREKVTWHIAWRCLTLVPLRLGFQHGREANTCSALHRRWASNRARRDPCAPRVPSTRKRPWRL